MSDKLDKLQKRTLRNPFEGGPHGWIQWKGTVVCLDVHCSCGEHTHIDADFAYLIQCGACGRVYGLNGHIELVPVDPEDVPENWHRPKRTDTFDD
jgi:hypothetical protein